MIDAEQEKLADYTNNLLKPIVSDLAHYTTVKAEATQRIIQLKVQLGKEFHNIKTAVGMNVDLRGMRLHINWQARLVRFKVTQSPDALAYVVVERAIYEWEGEPQVVVPQRSWESETVRDVRRQMQLMGFTTPYPTEGDGNISAFRICM